MIVLLTAAVPSSAGAQSPDDQQELAGIDTSVASLLELDDCESARARLRVSAASIGAEGDLPSFRPASRDAADDLLRRLTGIAEEEGCVAALTLRGLVQYSLAPSPWIPKDAPGQMAGRTWEEAAALSLVRAARSPGVDGAFAAAPAMRVLLAPDAGLLVMAERWGPTLLARLRERSYLADTTRYLLRGRLAAWLTDPVSAQKAFESYADAGGDADRVSLEIARARLGTMGDDSMYWAAAASPSRTVLDGLIADLAFIADSAELAELTALAPDARPAWLRTFWESRDLESLRPRGSRLVEHYRRLLHARRHFRILRYPRRYETFELWRNPGAEMDDRGLIYVRHGAPDDSARTAAGVCPNLSWLYRRPGGHNLIFHFVSREDVDDWRLLETLANANGLNGATNRLRREFEDFQCKPEPGMYESRAKLDPIYLRLANHETKLLWEAELALTTRSREIGTTTDSHEQHFARPLSGGLQTYALFGTGSTGRLLLVTSVEPPIAARGSDEVVLSQRIVAQSGDAIVELDSIRRFHAPDDPGDFLVFLTEHPLAAGPWNVGVLLRLSDSAGQVFRARADLPDATKESIALSDLLLGGANGIPWSARGGEFRLNSLGRYVSGAEIPIYYELAGVATGSTVGTTAIVQGEGRRVELRFEDRSDGGIQPVRRFIGTSDLRPGRYRLTIEVESGGAAAVRSTEFVVVEREGD